MAVTGQYFLRAIKETPSDYMTARWAAYRYRKGPWAIIARIARVCRFTTTCRAKPIHQVSVRFFPGAFIEDP